MAKKKEETKEQDSKWAAVATVEELATVKAKLEEHSQTIENFRTSFNNLETTIRTLKERNRLR